MDTIHVEACMQANTSISSSQFSSNINCDDPEKEGYISPARICLVGSTCDETLKAAVNCFGIEVVESETGREYVDDPGTTFVLQEFTGDVFDRVSGLKWRVLGASAVIECADQHMRLPVYRRPLFALTMAGVVTCFTGITDRKLAMDLMFMIRSLGGSVRKEPNRETTHLIAATTTGQKYRYAVTFIIPIMSPEWVMECWKHRHVYGLRATDEELMGHRQKPLLGVKASFIGFPDSELTDMEEMLAINGGEPVSPTDPTCTHIVVDTDDTPHPQLCPVTVPLGAAADAHIVRSDWFWLSIQHVARESEADFPVPKGAIAPVIIVTHTEEDFHSPSAPADDEDVFMSECPTSSPCQSPASSSSPTPCPCPGPPPSPSPSPRRKVSLHSLMSLAEPPSPRIAAFMELLQTEENYVNILDTILQIRSEALSTSQAGGVLLTETQAKIIFGPLMPISRTHHAILKDLQYYFNNWHEDAQIGEIYVRHSPELLRNYVPFVTSLEDSKDMLSQASEGNPRFHAFLKVCRGRPECGRQKLQDLMIRPVQRLASCNLLLREILKHTPEGCPDRQCLESALKNVSEVLARVNEDKRRMDSLCKVFDVFNLIDKCPADIIASHRQLVLQFEGVELTKHGASGLGDHVVFFVFTDVLLVCKKKSKAVALTSGRSQPANHFSDLVMRATRGKPYKFLMVLQLSHVRRIVDVADSEHLSQALGIVYRAKDEMRESVSYLRLNDANIDKAYVLLMLSTALAAHTCVTDPGKFVQRETADEAGVHASASDEILSKQLHKAAKMAVKTQCLVTNALGLGRSSTRVSKAGSPPPCSMTAFNSASRLQSYSACRLPSDGVLGDLEFDEDTEARPKPASLTPNIIKRM